MPDHYSFTTTIPIRITDINYGNHLGNDSVLALLHEARVQFLKSRQLDELEFAGTSLIMSDVMIEFRNEGFYGESLNISVAAGEFTRARFDLFYKVEKADGTLVAIAKTGMVCFDYDKRKVVSVPDVAKASMER